MRAYVLVRVKTGIERETLDALQDIEGLEEIFFLFGEYDYILTFEAPDAAALAHLLTDRIRRVPGVLQTITLLEAPFR